MKKTERNLPASCLYTSLELTDHDESRWKTSFHRDLSTGAMSTDASQVDVALFPLF